MVFSYQTPSITIEEKFEQGVSSCCGIHGYMAQGPCDAKRKVKRGKIVQHIETFLFGLIV